RLLLDGIGACFGACVRARGCRREARRHGCAMVGRMKHAWVLVFALSGAACQQVANAAPPAAKAPAVPPVPVGTKMKCPVSGEEFVVKEKTAQVGYNGKSYAFCCADCL